MCCMSIERDSSASGGSGRDVGLRSRSTVADLLGLDQRERDSGLWDEDFLWLGSRLRPIYGNCVSLGEDPPAYLVSFPRNLTVSVGCVNQRGEDPRVRVWAHLIELELCAPGIFQFALRENAELTLARLAVRQQWLTVEHELPFCGACIPALDASILAVAGTVARLRGELHAVLGQAAA
jgi:hypothetical protein